jgi:hypothetical protein
LTHSESVSSDPSGPEIVPAQLDPRIARWLFVLLPVVTAVLLVAVVSSDAGVHDRALTAFLWSVPILIVLSALVAPAGLTRTRRTTALSTLPLMAAVVAFDWGLFAATTHIWSESGSLQSC